MRTSANNEANAATAARTVGLEYRGFSATFSRKSGRKALQCLAMNVLTCKSLPHAVLAPPTFFARARAVAVLGRLPVPPIERIDCI